MKRQKHFKSGATDCFEIDSDTECKEKIEFYEKQLWYFFVVCDIGLQYQPNSPEQSNEIEAVINFDV